MHGGVVLGPPRSVRDVGFGLVCRNAKTSPRAADVHGQARLQSLVVLDALLQMGFRPAARDRRLGHPGAPGTLGLSDNPEDRAFTLIRSDVQRAVRPDR